MSRVPALPVLPEPLGASRGVVSVAGQHLVESGLRGLRKQVREDRSHYTLRAAADAVCVCVCLCR